MSETHGTILRPAGPARPTTPATPDYADRPRLLKADPPLTPSDRMGRFDEGTLHTKATVPAPTPLSEGPFFARVSAREMAFQANVRAAMERVNGRRGHEVAALLAGVPLSAPGVLTGLCVICGRVAYLDAADDSRLSLWGEAAREDCTPIRFDAYSVWWQTPGGAEKLQRFAPLSRINPAFFGFALGALLRRDHLSESDLADRLGLAPEPFLYDAPPVPKPSLRLATVRLLHCYPMPVEGLPFEIDAALLPLRGLEAVISDALDAVSTGGMKA